MEKKKVAPQAIIIVLLLIVIFLQYQQWTVVSQISEESESGDKYHQFRKQDLTKEFEELKAEMQVLAYNQQRNIDLSGLAAGNRTVEETENLPTLSGVSWQDDRLSVSIGEEIKESDTLFGLSLRNGLVIANHFRRPAAVYNGQIAHPLADQFILVLYRPGTYEQGGQMVSGAPPFARWSTSLTPIDRSD